MSDPNPSAPHVDCPRCPAGHPCGTPIRECHRQDAVTPGTTLWCPCCGAFWRGGEDDVLKAEMALIAWEEERGY